MLVKTLEVELEAKAAPFTVTDEALAASALAGRDNDGRMTTRRRANLRANAASLRNGGKVGLFFVLFPHFRRQPLGTVRAGHLLNRHQCHLK